MWGVRMTPEDEDTHTAFQSHSAVRGACRVYGTHTSWEHRADVVSVYCALLSGRFRLPIHFWKEKNTPQFACPGHGRTKEAKHIGGEGSTAPWIHLANWSCLLRA